MRKVRYCGADHVGVEGTENIMEGTKVMTYEIMDVSESEELVKELVDFYNEAHNRDDMYVMGKKL